MKLRNTTFVAVAGSGLAVVVLLVGAAMTRAAAPEAAGEEGFLLKEEPKNAKAVINVRKEAKNGEEVVVVGRIGGRTNPWVKGAAAFSIVDEAIKSCNQIPGDTCETPWDYCCEADLPQKTMFVTVVDDAGKLVKKDARQLLKVKELQTVVVKGKVKRDNTNNVSIQATSLYVRPEKRTGK